MLRHFDHFYICVRVFFVGIKTRTCIAGMSTRNVTFAANTDTEVSLTDAVYLDYMEQYHFVKSAEPALLALLIYSRLWRHNHNMTQTMPPKL